MRISPLLRVVLVCVLGGLLASCGGDGGSDERSATDPTVETTTSTTMGADEPTTSLPAELAATSASSTTSASAPRATSTTARSSGGGSATTAAGSSGTTAAPTPPTAGATAAIAIQNFTFSPPVLDVGLGTRVTATNRDAANHTWSSTEGAWDSGNLGQGQAFSFTFSKAGTFTYRCDIHPSMTGTVRVS